MLVTCDLWLHFRALSTEVCKFYLVRPRSAISWSSNPGRHEYEANYLPTRPHFSDPIIWDVLVTCDYTSEPWVQKFASLGTFALQTSIQMTVLRLLSFLKHLCSCSYIFDYSMLRNLDTRQRNMCSLNGQLIQPRINAYPWRLWNEGSIFYLMQTTRVSSWSEQWKLGPELAEHEAPSYGPTSILMGGFLTDIRWEVRILAVVVYIPKIWGFKS
jgi:hypothetical protein